MSVDNPANSPVILLCIQGAQAEFEGRAEEACRFYARAWDLAAGDYEASVAAHYVARCQADPLETLRWNLEALTRADLSSDDRVRVFYPSLYVNIGRAYQSLGDAAEAERYYRLAAESGLEYPNENQTESHSERLTRVRW